MPETYTPASTYHPSITVPVDGEPATAGSLVAIKRLADNTKKLTDDAGAHDAEINELQARPFAYTNADNNFDVTQHVDGELITTGEITAGSHVNAGGSVYTGPGGSVNADTNVLAGTLVQAPDFRHAAPGSGPSRTKHINLGLGCPHGDAATGNVGWIRENPITVGLWLSQDLNAELSFPVLLPNGAIVTSVDVLHLTTGAANVVEWVLTTPDWTNQTGSLVSKTAFSAATFAAGTFGKSTYTPGGGVTIDNVNAQYEVRIKAPASGASVAGVRVIFKDPGPRNT